jgi:hypothetical protein
LLLALEQLADLPQLVQDLVGLLARDAGLGFGVAGGGLRAEARQQRQRGAYRNS